MPPPSRSRWRPQAAHAREVVFQLRQLDLQLALGAACVRGEDVEDHGRAVDDGQADGLLEVALLARGQLVVAGDQVGVGGLRRGLRLGDLAGPEIGVRVRLLALLDHLPDDADAGGAQQLGRARRGRPRPSAAPPRRTRAGARAAPAPLARGRSATAASVLCDRCGFSASTIQSRRRMRRACDHLASAPRRCTASSSRSSGVVSEMRNQPSPAGP